ncbi:MAG: sugar transferase, partial [Gammaproteobacteria bacterium]|nr:sugar transferase [Gammaproteobacteria bacterium]
MTANIVLQTSKILALALDSSKIQSYLPDAELKWRQKNLMVNSITSDAELSFPALTRKQWLENCLSKSLSRRICIDLAVGERGIQLWADACDRAKKPIFMRINSHSELPNCRQTVYWRIKRMLDLLAATMILVILSPVMVLIALLIKIFTPGS